MKLQRNIDPDNLGKYAVLNIRRLRETCSGTGTFERWSPSVAQALETLSEVGALEWGVVGGEDEFFVMKLKDKYAKPALDAYAGAAQADDPEYASEVQKLASRAGVASPFCKKPD